jgi:methionine sulfoxide reductase heme-binding subunit
MFDDERPTEKMASQPTPAAPPRLPIGPLGSGAGARPPIGPLGSGAGARPPIGPLGSGVSATPARLPLGPLSATAGTAGALTARPPIGPLGPGPLGSPANPARPAIGPRAGTMAPARPLPATGSRAQGQRPAVYRGLPLPVRVIGWTAVAVSIGAVVGLTAPTALMRLGAVAALRPGMLDWYAVRALGFLAYIVLAGSVLYGLLLSTKILDAIAHRPVSFALHKDLSIVGLILISLHGLLLLGDASYPFTIRSILVPFASPYSPLAAGVGQVAFYATAVVTASFYVRRRIGQLAWRLIHYATFLSFIGGTAHGIFAGSDSGQSWAFWIYLVPTALAIFLITYRIVISVAGHLHSPESAGAVRSAALIPGPLDRPGAAS